MINVHVHCQTLTVFVASDLSTYVRGIWWTTQCIQCIAFAPVHAFHLFHHALQCIHSTASNTLHPPCFAAINKKNTVQKSWMPVTIIVANVLAKHAWYSFLYILPLALYRISALKVPIYPSLCLWSGSALTPADMRWFPLICADLRWFPLICADSRRVFFSKCARSCFYWFQLVGRQYISWKF